MSEQRPVTCLFDDLPCKWPLIREAKRLWPLVLRHSRTEKEREKLANSVGGEISAIRILEAAGGETRSSARFSLIYRWELG